MTTTPNTKIKPLTNTGIAAIIGAAFAKQFKLLPASVRTIVSSVVAGTPGDRIATVTIDQANVKSEATVRLTADNGITVDLRGVTLSAGDWASLSQKANKVAEQAHEKLLSKHLKDRKVQQAKIAKNLAEKQKKQNKKQKEADKKAAKSNKLKNVKPVVQTSTAPAATVTSTGPATTKAPQAKFPFDSETSTASKKSAGPKPKAAKKVAPAKNAKASKK